MSKYEPDRHEEPIMCPRGIKRCGAKNAPVESDQFDPYCWDCGEYLNVSSVDRGDTFIVTVEDMHETGAGVGKTDDNYVILVNGLVPPQKAKVEVTKVKESYSLGKIKEVLDSEPEESNGEDTNEQEESDETPSLGSRENYFG